MKKLRLSENSDNNVEIERLVREEMFHEQKYQDETNVPKHYVYNPTYKVFLRMREILGDIRGKRVLDCGCGDGWVTAELAAAGAIVDAFDISAIAVQRTEEFLKKKELSDLCVVRKAAAENLDYPDSTFDFVVGFAILHHLNLGPALKNIYRVMKPQGIGLFAEPLGSNPLINVYRRLTPAFRSPDERPLILSQFANQVGFFSDFSHEEFFLMSLGLLYLTHVPILGGLVGRLIEPCFTLDRILLRKGEFLRKYAWYSVISLKK